MSASIGPKERAALLVLYNIRPRTNVSMGEITDACRALAPPLKGLVKWGQPARNVLARLRDAGLVEHNGANTSGRRYRLTPAGEREAEALATLAAIVAHETGLKEGG